MKLGESPPRQAAAPKTPPLPLPHGCSVGPQQARRHEGVEAHALPKASRSRERPAPNSPALPRAGLSHDSVAAYERGTGSPGPRASAS